MSPRVAAYRIAVLVVGALGALTAGIVHLLPLAIASVATGAFLAATAITGRATTMAVSVVGTLSAVAGLALVSHVDPHDRPPATVAALLVLALSAVAVRATTAADLDGALVAAVGLAVVSASAATGRAAVLPLVGVVAALVAALSCRQHARRTHEPTRAVGGPPIRVIGACVGLAALALLAAPAPSSTGLHSSLFHRTSDHGGAPSSDVSPDSFGDNSLELGVRGKLSTDPVMDVTADAPTLWRGAIYQTYDGAAWHKPGPSAHEAVAAGGTVTLAATAADPRPPGTPVTVSVQPTGGQSAIGVYAPGVVTSVTSADQLQLGAAGSAQLTGNALAQPYVESVLLPVTDAGPLDAATGTDPAGWTQLPDTLPSRVHDLAVLITVGAPTRTAKVAAVESYLRSHERYTLDAPVPKAGADAVDDFLFRTHQGFCEQFASAETVLLRSVGIPARLVTGFSDGTVVADGRRAFTQADAHAWVEVSYGALGWSTSDPTAGSQLASAHRSLLSRVHDLVGSIGRSPARRAAAAGVIGGVLLLVFLATRVRGRRRARAEVRRGPVGTAFHRLERRFPRPPASTPREYAATLPGDVEDAVAAWEAELYAPVGPSPEATADAVRRVDELRRAKG